MTTLPDSTNKKLGLVIDLDTCVGCHACVTACKGWNTENYGAPLADQDAYGAEPVGSFLNRVHSFEVQPENGPAQLFHMPKSCLHCEDAPCVTVCPTGASYKREEDGIVLIDQEKCRGWRMCVSGCPYKKIYYNWESGKSEKCTFCYPRIESGQPTVCSETCVGRIRYLGVMLYGGFSSTSYSLQYNERSPTAWRPYMAPIKIIMCFAAFLMLLQAFALLFKDIAKLMGEEIPSPAELRGQVE